MLNIIYVYVMIEFFVHSLNRGITGISIFAAFVVAKAI